MAIEIKSSLNEIDVTMGEVLLKEMLIADPRIVANNPKMPLWTPDCVVMVDELDTQEIFNAWLIKNSKKRVDIQYPILGYSAGDIDTVFYGTGNRLAQWYFETSPKDSDWVAGDIVWVIDGQYRGESGEIVAIDLLHDEITVNVLHQNMVFSRKQLKPTGDKLPSVFKAKQITTTYDSVILVEQKQEARYLMNNFILRCADGQIWHSFESDIIPGETLHIFTVFGIPNLERLPKSDDKLDGSGYIYGVSWQTKVWAYLTDYPTPSGFIEQIRENIHIDTETRVNKIVIN